MPELKHITTSELRRMTAQQMKDIKEPQIVFNKVGNVITPIAVLIPYKAFIEFQRLMYPEET